jgi:mono/diheme cytochrome c family protein
VVPAKTHTKPRERFEQIKSSPYIQFMKKGITFLIVALCVGAELAHADQTTTPESNWIRHCKKCHGESGEPTKIGLKLKAPTNLFRSINNTTRDDLISSILDGRNKMPKYRKKLTAEEVVSLAEFLEHESLMLTIRDKEKKIEATLEQIKRDYKELPECETVIE